MTIDRGTAASWLQQLAAELEKRSFSVRLRQDSGRPPRLTVINRVAPVLAENVLVAADQEGQWNFFFSWPYRIGPVEDLMGAADRIERVLAEVGR